MELQLHVNIAITWTTIPFVRVHHSLYQAYFQYMKIESENLEIDDNNNNNNYYYYY